MAKYRKKPIVIEAEQWLPKKENWPGRAAPDELGVVWYFDATGTIAEGKIDTPEGQHQVAIGDWIITGIKGEKYPCKPDIFEQTYEKVEE